MDQQQEIAQYNPVTQFIHEPPAQPMPSNQAMSMDELAPTVNVRDPDTLEIGSIPSSQLQEAKAQGFESVSQDEAKSYVHEQKYGSIGQQSLTALEGAGSGLSFGLSTGLERAMGVSGEDITARRETNPIAHGLGETAGLVGSAFIPVAGEANLIEHAGVAAASKLVPAAAEGFGAAKALAAAKAAGLGAEEAQTAYKAAKAAEPFLVKVGSNAANQAVQFGLMQGGDEVSKMFASDPNQSFQSAITSVGLGAVLGGITGGTFATVSPLWQATAGKKTEAFLEKLKNRVNGDTIPIGNEFETVLKGAPSEIKAALSDDPQMKNYYQHLIESGTGSGEALRQTRDKFIDGAKGQIESAITPAENLSAFESGEKAKQALLDSVEKQHEAVRAKYDAVGDISQVQVPDESRLTAYDKLIEMGQNFGSKGSESSELFKNYGERFLAQDTIGQMDKLVTEVNSAKNVAYRAGDFEKSKALGDISEYVRNFQGNELDRQAISLAKSTGDESILAAAKQANEQRATARSSYRELMQNLGDIASVGKMGKIKSYGQFQEALEKIPSAKLAEKLFDKKNIEGLNYLKEKFPEVLDTLINQRKSDLLEAASKSGELSHVKAMNAINSLPSEVKSLMFSPEQLSAVESASKAIKELGVRMNPSGTARTTESLWQHLPTGVGAAVGLLTGHSPIVGGLIGKAAELLGKDVPDAIKLALMKFMGGNGPVDSAAFKATVDYAEKIYKGQKLVTSAAENLFKPGVEILGRNMIPTDKDRERLDKKVQELTKDPEKFMTADNKLHYYSPDHGVAAAQTAMSAVNFLNSMKPQIVKQSPLDAGMPVSFQQKIQYDRTLNIAQQPLVVVDHIKQGTLQPQDVATMKTLYPDLYTKISQELTNQMIETVHKEEPIPFKVRQGLNMFLNSPVDSTFLPANMQAIQNVFMAKNANQAAQGQAQAKVNTDKMKEISKSHMTAGQAAQERQLAKQ